MNILVLYNGGHDAAAVAEIVAAELVSRGYSSQGPRRAYWRFTAAVYELILLVHDTAEAAEEATTTDWWPDPVYAFGKPGRTKLCPVERYTDRTHSAFETRTNFTIQQAKAILDRLPID